MDSLPVVIGVGIAFVLLALVVLWPRVRDYWAMRELERVRNIFYRRREWAEAKFMTLASESGKPRGLAWVECEFDNGVSFARDRESGDLRALVAVTISFEAIEGGGMEDNPNVGNLRAATAVFRFDGNDWTTDGRAIFNLNPLQAIEHFQHELETVD
ncbi:MAG TPA: hypothetical protein DCY79_03730 [Planctomycetaceae bacterium]|nr:hypothetical protein [Blastopirellula sp.]HAY78894.1 hypothetical protein [Planctomycetaceae bacterium]